jgi:hypothetical protein
MTKYTILHLLLVRMRLEHAQNIYGVLNLVCVLTLE